MTDPLPTERASTQSRVAIVKVLVQPVLVVVDGDGFATELRHPTLEVAGRDWHDFSATAFDGAHLERIRVKLEDEDVVAGGPPRATNTDEQANPT